MPQAGLDHGSKKLPSLPGTAAKKLVIRRPIPILTTTGANQAADQALSGSQNLRQAQAQGPFKGALLSKRLAPGAQQID